MRKLMLAVLVVLMVLSVMTVPALADSPVTVSVVASKTDLQPGDQFTLAVHVHNPGNVGIGAFQFTFPVPDGCMLVSETHDAGNGTFNSGTGIFSGNYLSGGKTSTDWDPLVYTLQVKTDISPLGSRTIANPAIAVLASPDQQSISNQMGTAVTLSITHAEHNWDNGTVTVEPTCQKEGTKTYNCQTPGCPVAPKTETLDKLDHKWGEATWSDWAEPYEELTITLTCSGNGTGAQKHTLAKTVAATPSGTDATCTTPGKTTYTASYTFGTGDEGNGKPYKTSTEVVGKALGHKWGEPETKWDGDQLTVTRHCIRPGDENTADNPVTATGTKVETASKCETPGSYHYEAKVTLKGEAEARTFESEPVEIPAKGHAWPDEVTFNWDDKDPRDPSAKVTEKVACQSPDCDNAVYKAGVELTVTVEQTEIKEPNCEDAGYAVYTATAKTPDGQKPYEKTGHKITIPATGHKWGEAKFTWTETPGKYTATASRVCENDPEHKQNVEATVTSETTAPTYAKDGSIVYTASAKFEGEDDPVTETKTETLEKLPLPTPEANVPTENVGAGAEEALKDSAESIVEDVLNDRTPAGVPDTIIEAIKKAAASNDAKSMSVSTELKVAQTEYDGATAAYDVSITMTVTGENVNVTEKITHVSEPIEFKLPKGNAGPIVKVVHVVNNGEQTVDSKVVGDNIVFSAQDFSTYAILSSNDLADAEITGVDSQYTYTGSEIRPAVKVTINGGNEDLQEGKDYTVSYTNNTNAGTATVTITAKEGSRFTGSQTVEFKIVKTASGGTNPTAAPAGDKDKVPATGDDTPVALYAALLIVSAGALVMIFFLRRKSKSN